MNSNDIANWFGYTYGDSLYYSDCNTLADAKTKFNNEFTTFMKINQYKLDNYYNTLVNNIVKYVDDLQVNKTGSTILEKHKGRKESYNKDETKAFNEDTTESTKTEIKEENHENYTDTTNHGKDTRHSQKYTDKTFRGYFGTAPTGLEYGMAANEVFRHDTDDTSDNSGNLDVWNRDFETGSTSVGRVSNGNTNYKKTIGDEDNNFTNISKNEDNNFEHTTATANDNYKTIEDISALIFDKDVMDYNDYQSNTRNKINELNNYYRLLDKLHDKTFVEEILIQFFNKISYWVS